LTKSSNYKIINIGGGYLLYAHKINDTYEALEEHRQRTRDNIAHLENERALLKDILELYNINTSLIEKIIEMKYYSLENHDIGKCNYYFQKIKMLNENIKDSMIYTNHSLLSSLLIINKYYKEIILQNNKREKCFLMYMLIQFTYLVSKHHVDLSDFNINEYINSLKNLNNMIKENPKILCYYDEEINIDFDMILRLYNSCQQHIINKATSKNELLYIYLNITYSQLVNADIRATYEFLNGYRIKDNTINKSDVENMKTTYESTDIYKYIKSYNENKQNYNNELNKLRNDIFLEVDSELDHNINNHLFFIDAPTGAGKSNISLNSIIKIAENRIRTRLRQSPALFGKCLVGGLKAQAAEGLHGKARRADRTSD
jgi:CRISPR-associated endonuclease/helicase Cas3